MDPLDNLQHRDSTREAYQRLASVWAETDDNLWNEALERAAVRRLLGRMRGDRPTEGVVLDAGCASGSHAAWLEAQGHPVIGIDISSNMVAEARRRCSPRSQFAVADLADPLPFADRAFDGVLCSLTLHYLEDVATPLAEFARVLRPEGWLIVTLDHPAGSGGRVADGTDSYFTTRLVTDTWTKAGVTVTQQFWRRPLQAMVDALANAGFLVERIDEPQPDDEARERFPQESAAIEGRPTFIAYLAVPVPVPDADQRR